MSRLPIRAASALLVIAVAVPATRAAAQMPTSVRVVSNSATFKPYYQSSWADVATQIEAGATLQVLDRQKDWYWVIAPPDGHGTAKPGWVRVADVEAIVAAPGGDSMRTLGTVAGADEASSTNTIAEDRVAITAANNADTPAVGSSLRFEDIHFDRDRSALRADDLAVLRAAVAALKANPSLVVNVEGYTCNLGTPKYNLALGLRRANAVKEFLVSEGIPAERLHAVSLGETNPKYDNSKEDTRKLNRRVAVVPGPTAQQ
jgi:outer membrane protein OmpA-like peptidoglycan-associated protein